MPFPPPSDRAPAVAAIAALAAVLAACTPQPVVWEDGAAMPLVAEDASELLEIDAAGRPHLVPAPALPATLPAGARCEQSVRVTTVPRGSGRATVAVWWAPRPDGSAALLAAESLDGGATWSTTVPVDTLDRGSNGCARPAPAVASDSATGYVHVAYPLWAPEGAGVFFSHTMPGHFMFHAPVVVAYGDHPGETSVAAAGDVVAVAYEEPNARVPRIALALSRTQGHAFEHPVVDLGAIGDARRPRVAMRGRTLAVAWRRPQRPVTQSAAAATTAGEPLVRTGTLRD